MENPINIDDFGGKTTILGNIFFRRSEGGIFSISLRQVTAFSKVLIKAFFAISSACDGPTAGSVPVPQTKPLYLPTKRRVGMHQMGVNPTMVGFPNKPMGFSY